MNAVARQGARAPGLMLAGGLLLALLAAFALAPRSAEATPIYRFNLLPSTTQAGGHPDLAATFLVGNRNSPGATGCCSDMKEANVSAPAGFVINPNATPQCSQAQFVAEHCPTDSQVGVAQIAILGGNTFFLTSGLYNLKPRPGEPGSFGFQIPLFKAAQYVIARPRTGGDFGLDIFASSVSHALPFSGVRIVTWGVPAHPSHDPLRFYAGEQRDQEGGSASLCDSDKVTKSTDDPNTMKFLCEDRLGNQMKSPMPSNSPLTPLLRNPTTCGKELSSTLVVNSYDLVTTTAEAPYPATTGCDQLSFNPSLSAQPTTTQGDAPSGLDIELSVPQEQSAFVPSPSEIKKATVTLPEGFSINSNAADGKTSCSDVAARFGSEEPALCPEFAKIGSIEIDSALLPGPLSGYVYLGDPLPGDRYRMILTGSGYGVDVKLKASIKTDAQTGRVVTVFDDLPQTPFEEFRMHLFGSERGVLATPTRCGTYEVNSEFVPWDDQLPNQTSKQFFTIDTGPGGGPCPGITRPFAPQLSSGMEDNTAGQSSAFGIEVQRPDGDQSLSTINVTTPPGFSGSLAGIAYCPEAALQLAASPGYSGVSELSTPSCPASSEIGTATAGAGSGSRPIYLGGKVYLGGPYKGAPLSLAVITPVVSGPYDLGNLVVRAALQVDPLTAQITAVSDPLPQIIEGIPLRLRSIQIRLDRKGFTINPTHCAPETVGALIGGLEGGTVSLASHFQAANCSSLEFAPKLAIKISKGTRRANPALTATLMARPGDANLSRVAVTLPKTTLVDQDNIGNVCTRVQFAAKACPGGSMIGNATATTPLLDGPLSGPVYLASSNNKLPDLLVALDGQIAVQLRGRIDTVKGRNRTTFENIPDVPVSSFTLRTFGGKRGLLQNALNVCKQQVRVDALIVGQNSARADQSPVFKAPCGNEKGSAKSKRRGADRGRGTGR